MLDSRFCKSLYKHLPCLRVLYRIWYDQYDTFGLTTKWARQKHKMLSLAGFYFALYSEIKLFDFPKDDKMNSNIHCPAERKGLVLTAT